MKKILLFIIVLITIGVGFLSCKKYLDVNTSPNNVTNVGIEQILPVITGQLGYTGATSSRVTAFFMQQFSANGPIVGNSNFKEIEKYNPSHSVYIGGGGWEAFYGPILRNIEVVISKAEEGGSPHYAGVAKILKAYTYQLLVDEYGDVPYSEAIKFGENYHPKYDDAATIYTSLFELLDAGIADINNPVSKISPNDHETIYRASSWEDARNNWERLANTIKLRLYLHYSELDPNFLRDKMTALINSGAKFIESNDNNFKMDFFNVSRQQNPLYSIELGQFRDQLYPNSFLVDLMNLRDDPRRAAYFVPFPFYSNPKEYVGTNIQIPTESRQYSRLHSYVYGTPSAVDAAFVNGDGSLRDGAITYGGDSPARLLNSSEYYFIRAEASLLYGVPGDPQEFFKQGILASLNDAGVAAADQTSYINQHGTLSGSDQDKLKRIIEEKYIANLGVIMEPWTDYRRTGYPAITPVGKPLGFYDVVPRSMIYPQSEEDNNPNTPARTDLLQRVFWDVN